MPRLGIDLPSRVIHPDRGLVTGLQEGTFVQRRVLRRPKPIDTFSGWPLAAISAARPLSV